MVVGARKNRALCPGRSSQKECTGGEGGGAMHIQGSFGLGSPKPYTLKGERWGNRVCLGTTPRAWEEANFLLGLWQQGGSSGGFLGVFENSLKNLIKKKKNIYIYIYIYIHTCIHIYTISTHTHIYVYVVDFHI